MNCRRTWGCAHDMRWTPDIWVQLGSGAGTLSHPSCAHWLVVFTRSRASSPIPVCKVQSYIDCTIPSSCFAPLLVQDLDRFCPNVQQRLGRPVGRANSLARVFLPSSLFFALRSSWKLDWQVRLLCAFVWEGTTWWVGVGVGAAVGLCKVQLVKYCYNHNKSVTWFAVLRGRERETQETVSSIDGSRTILPWKRNSRVSPNYSLTTSLYHIRIR